MCFGDYIHECDSFSLSTEQTIWVYVKMKETLVREWRYWELGRLIETHVESHTLTQIITFHVFSIGLAKILSC